MAAVFPVAELPLVKDMVLGRGSSPAKRRFTATVR
jgi:hypothetical protein